MGESKLTDVERPRLGDDLYKHPHKPTLHAVDPADQLPRPVSTVRMEDAVAPPLNPETFVCMGDESVFVIRNDWGDVKHQVAPERVRRTAAGDYHLLQSSPDERLPISGWQPLRPPCEHYKRVMTAFENDKVIRHVERVCTAQRGEHGEYVSLADQQVFACDHREPRDFVSEERLRSFDDKRVAEGKRSEEDWDPEQAVTRSLGPKGEKHGSD